MAPPEQVEIDQQNPGARPPAQGERGLRRQRRGAGSRLGAREHYHLSLFTLSCLVRLHQALDSRDGLFLRLGIERRIQELARTHPQGPQHGVRIVLKMQPGRVDRRRQAGERPNEFACRLEIRGEVHQHHVGP